MRENSGPNTDPCGTPGLIDCQLEDYHHIHEPCLHLKIRLFLVVSCCQK